MNTKTITIKVDWLYMIDGLTVAQAIEYLETFDHSYKLDCYLDGDTHGCEIVSRLQYEVPMTDDEIFAKLEKQCNKEIALYTSAREKHLKDGRAERVANCDRLLVQFNDKLNAAKLKYGKTS